jgi:GNAT superfamily N-acetyltransferase
VRRAVPPDAAGIAAVKVAAWRWAYDGLLPKGVLDGLDPALEEAGWRSYLEAIPAAERLWVVEASGRIVGFARTGPGEVHGLYLAPDRAGTGLGRRLFRHAVDDLTSRGFVPVVLWHFVGNERAAAFYERNGFVLDGAVRQSDFGVDEARRRGPDA